jgi:hypothetical protein
MVFNHFTDDHWVEHLSVKFKQHFFQFLILLYDNDLDQLSIFASTPTYLLHFWLKRLSFLSLFIKHSVSQTQAS